MTTEHPMRVRQQEQEAGFPDQAPQSGICSVCLDGCTGLCEIAKSSYRVREVIYPKPFERSQQALQKNILLITPTLTFRGPVSGLPE